jgi:FemAB-related protein (PEP-CTERM system-associated)
MALDIHPLQPAEYQQWDEFVFRHPQGTPFHLLAWKRSIQESFGYVPMYLVAAENNSIRAALPLFLVRNLLVGKALISSPFAVYGGILADSPQAQAALGDHVRETAASLKVDYVELRNAYPEQRIGFEGVSRYVTFTQPIASGEDAILRAIPRKTRYTVRKALAQPFWSRRQTARSRHFEDLYAKSLKRLGTPSFPSSHFAALLKNFQGMIDIREILLGEKVVAAVMSFYFRDQVLPYYGASDPAFHEQAPNNFMYFDLMRWAGENGYRVFDFGRSRKESGSYAFKAHWGMRMRELPYEMLPVRRKDLPHYSPNNPKFQGMIKVWQNLPLLLTRVLGPKVLPLFP